MPGKRRREDTKQDVLKLMPRAKRSRLEEHCLAEKKASRTVQRDKICMWRKRKWSGKRMHEELVRKWGANAYTYSSVLYHINRLARRARGVPERRRGRKRADWLDAEILEVRSQNQSISARGIAKEIDGSQRTVLRHIHEIGAVFKPTPRIPHELTPSQKRARVACAHKLLKHLRRRRNWTKTITGDESQMYFDNDPTEGWVFPGEQQQTRLNRCTADPKRLFVVFFSTSGFHLKEFMPEGVKVNAGHMEDFFTHMRRNLRGPLWIHMDNATPHRARSVTNTLKFLKVSILPHPPYSPDLSPADFWLFGRIKQALGRTRFKDEAEMEAAVLDVIEKCKKSEIRKVFGEWIRRLQTCIDNGGEYVHITT